jgi:hypothetical protein
MAAVMRRTLRVAGIWLIVDVSSTAHPAQPEEPEMPATQLILVPTPVAATRQGVRILPTLRARGII